MKKLLTIVFITSIFWSCDHNNQSNIVGTWIQVNNYQAPGIFIFKEDSFMYSYDQYEPLLYKIKNDTILFQTFNEISKMRYKFKHDTLVLLSMKSDTLYKEFVRNDSNKVLDIWNKTLNKSVNIPTLPTENFNWKYNDNTIIFDNDSSKELIYNSKQFPLNSNLYYQLLDTTKDNFLSKNVNLFIDKDVKYKDIKILLDELSKANLRRVNYLSYDSSSALNKLSFTLPLLTFKYPDSIQEQYSPPPQPPSISYNFNKDSDLICEFRIDKLIVNNVSYTWDGFESQLINRLEAKKQPTLFIHFDENIHYAKYIYYLHRLRNIYAFKRKQYAQEKFGTSNFRKLNSDQRDGIREKYLMKMKYVDKKWMEKYSKN